MSFPFSQQSVVDETREEDRAIWFDSSRWTFIVFSISLIVLAVLFRNQISDASPFETGDAAANSLLVRDAKTLQLTVGNYSRLGFNHPGPALLYVLAAGEVFFHDLMHVARSPFGGQILGLATWNAILLALIFKQLRRAAGHLTGVALFSLMIVLLAKLQPEAFTGNWFPYVYILPFAFFVVSVATVQTQSTHATHVPHPTQRTALLGFATGVLWNAHVAFIPITLIVLASMIGQLMLRDGVKSFCTHRARSFIPAVVIVALFQVPLCIELSQRWPSPVRDYLTFGSDNPHNSLLDAVRFTVSFWPITNGLAGISWIVGLIVLVILGRRSQALGQALMCVVLSCTVAVFVYAVVGIDDLHLRYVALFYRAAVSLGIAGAVVAGAVIAGEERIGGRRSTVISKAVSKAVSMVSVAAIVLGFVFVWRQRPIVGIPDQSLLADSKRFAAATGESGARLHADIENWGFVWPRLVGLQVDADRRGATRSCIDTRWQVLFTVEAKCGASDQLRPDVRVEAALDAAGKPVHLNFVPIDLRLQTGDFFVPGAQGDADAALILGRGWSDIESGRIWTDTQTSSLDFSLAPGKQADVEFDVEGLIGGTQTEVRAEVLVNGDKVDSWVFNRALNRGVRTLTVRSTPSGRSVVEFTVSVHRSAAQLGLGPDRRKVGLALLRVDVHSVHNTA